MGNLGSRAESVAQQQPVTEPTVPPSAAFVLFVVRDFFQRSGMPPELVNVVVEEYHRLFVKEVFSVNATRCSVLASLCGVTVVWNPSWEI